MNFTIFRALWWENCKLNVAIHHITNVKCGLLEDIESHLVGTLHTKRYGTSHDKCEVLVANGELYHIIENPLLGKLQTKCCGTSHNKNDAWVARRH